MEKSNLEMEGVLPELYFTFPHMQFVWPSLLRNSTGESSPDHGTYCTIFCICGTASRCAGQRTFRLLPVHSAHFNTMFFWHLGKSRLLACFTAWHQQQARPKPAEGCGITYQVSRQYPVAYRWW